MTEIQTGVDQNPEILIGTEANLDQANKYNDIQDSILAEKIRRRDAVETSRSGSALNLETKGRGNDRNSNRGRSKSKNSNRNRSKSRSAQQVQCWNYGKIGHFRNQCKSPKKKNEDNSGNAITEEVQDALLLAIDNPLDDQVLDSRVSFHTSSVIAQIGRAHV